jgi:hypothetical protein
MSKKAKIIGGIVAVIIAVVLYMAFSGGGATEADLNKGAEVDKALDGEIGQDDRKVDVVADSLADAVDLGEFDPNDI